MSAVAIATCVCGSMLPEPVLCSDHHRYWRSGQRLTSVSHVIRSCWPVKKDFEAAPAEILAHARERGSRIDAHFSTWLRTGELRIQRGTEWQEVVIGVRAVIDWWRSEGIRGGVPQVMLAGESEAGTADVIADATVCELKTVNALEVTYDIQVGAYADLMPAIREGFILHCKFEAGGTKVTVKAVPVDLKSAVSDWRSLRDVWRIAQRRAPKKTEALCESV